MLAGSGPTGLRPATITGTYARVTPGMTASSIVLESPWATIPGTVMIVSSGGTFSVSYLDTEARRTVWRSTFGDPASSIALKKVMLKLGKSPPCYSLLNGKLLYLSQK